jgi:hypothetical protein
LPVRYYPMEKTRELVACGLWVLALSFMVDGSLNNGLPAFAWGLFLVNAASIVTGWMIVDRCDRNRSTSVEHIAEVVDALHQGKSDISRLH